MKLLAQLPCLLFFFSQLSFLTQFVSSLISPPSPQFISLKKKLMFSHMFLWVFFFFFGCTDVGCFSVGWIFLFFYFFGSIDAGCFLRIVILVFIFYFFMLVVSCKMFGVVFLCETLECLTTPELVRP